MAKGSSTTCYLQPSEVSAGSPVDLEHPAFTMVQNHHSIDSGTNSPNEEQGNAFVIITTSRSALKCRPSATISPTSPPTSSHPKVSATTSPGSGFFTSSSAWPESHWKAFRFSVCYELMTSQCVPLLFTGYLFSHTSSNSSDTSHPAWAP